MDKYLQSESQLDHTFSVITCSITKSYKVFRTLIMFNKMMIFFCLAMVATVANANVIPCAVTANTTQGLQDAADCTLSSCESALSQCSDSGSTGIGAYLSSYLSTTTAGLLTQVVNALGDLLATLLTVVLRFIKLVLTLITELVNIVAQLLDGVTTNSQCDSGIKQWYSSAGTQVNTYQSLGITGSIINLVLELLKGLNVNLGNGDTSLLTLKLLGLKVSLGGTGGKGGALYGGSSSKGGLLGGGGLLGLGLGL